MALLFYADLHRHLGPLGWGRMLSRAALSVLAMGATAWALAPIGRPLAILACVAVYLAALFLLRALTPEEWRMLAPLLPKVGSRE